MIDPKLLRTEPDTVRASLTSRGEDPALVDELLAADVARRSAIAEYESLRSEQKGMGKQVAQAQGDQKQQLLAHTKELAARVKQADADSSKHAARFDTLLRELPNLVLPGVPEGGEDEGTILETVGQPRDFADEGITVRDHLEIGTALGAIDMERGAKVSGSRFYILTGIGAQLELALVNFAMATALEHGFTPVIPPALVRPSAMDGTGFLGQAAQDVYHLPQDDLYLVGTSEVALAGMHADEILESLPIRYAGYSPCFRREAGSHGKDTRGIFRVHWFDKVEMFVYCDAADAEAQHEQLLTYEKQFLTALEIPFQVLNVASGDLGQSAARKYDCYSWVPSQDRYREITSTSNCTEYQSRRLNIRTRTTDRIAPVATLNGTLCAVTRTIIAILENHQQADGSVRVPEALRPYLGGREALAPVA